MRFRPYKNLGRRFLEWKLVRFRSHKNVGGRGGRGVWNDRDGPKWLAPVREEKGDEVEEDLNGRPPSEGNKNGDGVCGMTETDLNGWPLSEGKRRMSLKKTKTDLNGPCLRRKKKGNGCVE